MASLRDDISEAKGIIRRAYEGQGKDAEFLRQVNTKLCSSELRIATILSSETDLAQVRRDVESWLSTTMSSGALPRSLAVRSFVVVVVVRGELGGW